MNIDRTTNLIQTSYKFLFSKYKFGITFKSERKHPLHIRVGLESDLYKIKLLFVHEWGISLFISALDTSFVNDDGWVNCERIIDFIKKRPLRWPPLKLNEPYLEYIVKDMNKNGQEFEKLSKQIFKMFLG